jgi:hypothetical protein
MNKYKVNRVIYMSSVFSRTTVAVSRIQETSSSGNLRSPIIIMIIMIIIIIYLFLNCAVSVIGLVAVDSAHK